MLNKVLAEKVTFLEQRLIYPSRLLEKKKDSRRRKTWAGAYLPVINEGTAWEPSGVLDPAPDQQPPQKPEQENANRDDEQPLVYFNNTDLLQCSIIHFISSGPSNAPQDQGAEQSLVYLIALIYLGAQSYIFFSSSNPAQDPQKNHEDDDTCEDETSKDDSDSTAEQ